jgi:hypothetical protein
VWHDTKARLEDSSHHRHIGAMPQELAVGEIIVLAKPLFLGAKERD